MYYFTADQHFGHQAIIRLAKRPFASHDEMMEELIDRHNRTVRDKDIVFMLGDIGYKLPPRHLAKILSRLRGRMKLLPGNHDRKLLAKGQRKGVFDDLCHSGRLQILGDYHELRTKLGDDKLMFCLFHYPLHTWNGSTYGAWHLHGHSHGHSEPKPYRVDVGVDAWAYRPASLQQVLARGRAGIVRVFDREDYLHVQDASTEIEAVA